MDILYIEAPRAACFNYIQDLGVCTCEVILLLRNIWKWNFLVKNSFLQISNWKASQNFQNVLEVFSILRQSEQQKNE